jgi:hypothetical protein
MPRRPRLPGALGQQCLDRLPNPIALRYTSSVRPQAVNTAEAVSTYVILIRSYGEMLLGHSDEPRVVYSLPYRGTVARTKLCSITLGQGANAQIMQTPRRTVCGGALLCCKSRVRAKPRELLRQRDRWHVIGVLARENPPGRTQPTLLLTRFVYFAPLQRHHFTTSLQLAARHFTSIFAHSRVDFYRIVIATLTRP